MNNAIKKQLLRLILEILAIIGALLLGLSAGCSVSWGPAGAQVDFLYPRHQIGMQFTAANTTTRPAEDPRR